MGLALTDSAIVIGIMTVIGLLGYLMDRQVDGGENKVRPSDSASRK